MAENAIGKTTDVTATPPLLSLRNIVSVNMGYEVLRSVSIDFAEGRCAVIRGNSGSGKSTLLKVAAGITVPEGGSVFYNGANLAKLSRTEVRAFYLAHGFVFQDAALWSNMSLIDNLILPQKALDPHVDIALAARKATEAAKALGYEESLTIRPAQLSLGEQKLISIARATLFRPATVFMDEPFAHLDESATERVLELVLNLKDEGTTLLVVTHDAELTSLVADDLVVISQGCIASSGDIESQADALKRGDSTRITEARKQKEDKTRAEAANADDGWEYIR